MYTKRALQPTSWKGPPKVTTATFDETLPNIITQQVESAISKKCKNKPRSINGKAKILDIVFEKAKFFEAASRKKVVKMLPSSKTSSFSQFVIKRTRFLVASQIVDRILSLDSARPTCVSE